MGARLVILWVVLSIAAAETTRLAYSVLYPHLQHRYAYEVVIVIFILAPPIAQWLALRLAGLDWGREWAFATAAGSVLASVVMTVFELLPHHIRAGIPGQAYMWMFTIAGVSSTLLLQWLVLRRHAPSAVIWPAVGAVVWIARRALDVALAGSWDFSAFPRLSTTMALSLSAATALIEAFALMWILSRERTREEVPPFAVANKGWLWLEWSISAAIGLPLIMGVLGWSDVMFVDRPWQGAVYGRPASAAFAGLVIGGTQRWLLREWLPLPRKWVAISVAALAVPALGIFAISAAALAVPALGIFIPIVNEFVFWGWVMTFQMPLGMAIAGTWFGACQWFVLRNHGRRALVWVPATAIAWGISQTKDPAPGSEALQTIGFFAGLISSVALFVLASRPSQTRTGR